MQTNADAVVLRVPQLSNRSAKRKCLRQGRRPRLSESRTPVLPPAPAPPGLQLLPRAIRGRGGGLQVGPLAPPWESTEEQTLEAQAGDGCIYRADHCPRHIQV